MSKRPYWPRPAPVEQGGERKPPWKERLKKHARTVLGVVVALLLFSSFFQVEAGEIAVMRTFGRMTAQLPPGLHFRFPFVQEVDIVNVSQVRRLEVGFRGEQPIDAEAQMLTGDENIVEARMIVQYQVKNPVQFLFHLADPEDALRATSEVALRSVIGKTTIDDAITQGRALVQDQTRKMLQELMDSYESGLAISEVKLQSVDPPTEVKDSFHDVVRAREEKEKLINQAKGYREDVMPRARGEAEKIVREAEAYKQERILRAEGDAKRFDQAYAEYQKAKAVTRERLYVETMERIYAKTADKTLIDPKLPGSTLQVLNLAAAQGAKP